MYESAKLYHSLGYYKSAIVSCTNALDDYPDMINRLELSFLIVGDVNTMIILKEWLIMHISWVANFVEPANLDEPANLNDPANIADQVNLNDPAYLSV